ncbi:hypothetical protein F4809DRAFT_506202 [Biscogniauxia mediterranea]|nr:hypothetical protein F4809DRAFT_506202 [Biscogniauxia mediterranea]
MRLVSEAQENHLVSPEQARDTHTLNRSCVLWLFSYSEKIATLVAHIYKECVLGKRAPAIPALESLLNTLLKSISQNPRQNEYIWIVIDGFDECDTQRQATNVATLINQITSTTPSSVRATCKVLISSRISPALSSRLRRKQVLSLSDEKESTWLVIKHYTSQRLSSLQGRSEATAEYYFYGCYSFRV